MSAKAVLTINVSQYTILRMYFTYSYGIIAHEIAR
jgi:hypothetical protein